MYIDFKEAIIRLMHHPIMSKPLSSLTDDELEDAYMLLKKLSYLSIDEEHSQLDFFQMARLEYNLGELAYYLGDADREGVIHHYHSALNNLIKGGFDLSMDKWTELISLRNIEY